MSKFLDFAPCGIEVRGALTLLAQRRRPEPPDSARMPFQAGRPPSPAVANQCATPRESA